MEKQDEQKLLIENGMSLAANLPDIMPDQANEKMKEIYEDTQQTLRVPFVNLIFRTLANYPEYLIPAWKQFSPYFRTLAFENLADETRAKAFSINENNLTQMSSEAYDDMDRIRAFNDTIHYVLPKLLIIVTVFYETTFGSVAEGDERTGTGIAEIPTGIAEGTLKLSMANPDEAEGKLKLLFRSIKERHGHSLVSSYYRALGNYPDFLEAVWNQVKPIIGSEEYEKQKNIVINSVYSGIQNLPISKLKSISLNNEKLDKIKAILSAFQLRFIPEMLLDVVLIKTLLDGAEAAPYSPFSVGDKKY